MRHLELEGRIAEYLRELPKVTACFDLERDHFKERIATLEAKLKQAREAIRWALGENGEFEPPHGDTYPRYWWRAELRLRAAMDQAKQGQP